MKKILLLIAITLLTSGCAQMPYWTMTDDMNRVVKSTSFEFNVADGWVRTSEPHTYERVEIDGKVQTVLLEAMAVTRDGTRLHGIFITRRYPDTAFPTLKKKSSPNMLPPEAADLYVAELRKRSGLERLEVVSNKPATIDGKPGFELITQFKNEEGLRIRLKTYGFVDKTGFYTIAYRAPYLYYFERDLKAFETLAKSFRQAKGAFEPPPEIPAWAKFFN